MSPRLRQFIRRVPGAAKVVGAVLSVAVAVGGILLSALAAQESKRAEQLSLVTALDSKANESNRELNETAIVEKFCAPVLTRRTQLTRDERAKLLAILGTYEYFAWLFNTGRLEEVTTGRDYWAPRMIQAYNVGAVALDRDLRSQYFPQLAKFRRETKRADWPPPVCGDPAQRAAWYAGP